MPPISEDGRSWWDGSRWQSLYSADGKLKWDGQAWQPIAALSEPAAQPTPGAPSPALAEVTAVEPSKPLGQGPDWSQEIEPSKALGGGPDWSQGAPDRGGDVAVVHGNVANRPNWLAAGEGYHEGFGAPPPSPGAAQAPQAPAVMPWQVVPGPQTSRIIPIVAAGALALLALIWVAGSAGVTVPIPELPFLSHEEPSTATAPAPSASPRPPAVAGRYPRPAERYATIMSIDGTQLNGALAAVTEACPPQGSVEQCRPAALNALSAVRAYRQDLAQTTVPVCLRGVNAELLQGLDLYDRGLVEMANAQQADQVAAGEASFDRGTHHLIAVNRLLDRVDPSTCR